jgi:hypothetical protein
MKHLRVPLVVRVPQVGNPWQFSIKNMTFGDIMFDEVINPPKYDRKEPKDEETFKFFFRKIQPIKFVALETCRLLLRSLKLYRC